MNVSYLQQSQSSNEQDKTQLFTVIVSDPKRPKLSNHTSACFHKKIPQKLITYINNSITWTFMPEIAESEESCDFHIYMHIKMKILVFNKSIVHQLHKKPKWMWIVSWQDTDHEFPAQKCRSIKKRSHETGSRSEKVHGCRILPYLANNRCASQERATQRCDFSRIAAGKTIFLHPLLPHEPHSLG